MDLFNLILDPLKMKATCFLCFSQNDNSTCVYETFEIIDKYYRNTISLMEIMKTLFPMHDIVLEQACENCTNLIIQIYKILQRNYYKKCIINKIIDEVTEGITKDTAKNSDRKRLKIYMKLSELNSNECIFPQYKNTIFKKTNGFSQNHPKKSIPDSKEFNFKDWKTLNRPRHKATICDKCGKVCTTPQSLRSHLNSHMVKQCPYCFRTLKTHEQFYIHVKRHTTNLKHKRNNKYYRCQNCIYKSSTKQGLEAHINKIHLFLKPYKCMICSKGFYKKGNLIEHDKTHEGTKNATCELCGENFVSEKTLRIHLKVHSGDKMYPCQLCEKTFVTSGQRLEHSKRKHMDKSENCLTCGKMFSLKKDLTRHVKKVHSHL